MGRGGLSPPAPWMWNLLLEKHRAGYGPISSLLGSFFRARNHRWGPLNPSQHN